MIIKNIMRKLVFIAFMGLLSVADINAQVMVTKINNQNLTELDKQYMTTHKIAYDQHTSEDYLFKGQESQFEGEWKKMMFSLYEFCQKRNMKWQPGGFCYLRIFFTAKGKPEVIEYHTEGLLTGMEKEFEQVLIEFYLSYQLQITGPMPFWNFGNLKFTK